MAAQKEYTVVRVEDRTADYGKWRVYTADGTFSEISETIDGTVLARAKLENAGYKLVRHFSRG